MTFKPLGMVMTCGNQVIITKPGHKYINTYMWEWGGLDAFLFSIMITRRSMIEIGLQVTLYCNDVLMIWVICVSDMVMRLQEHYQYIKIHASYSSVTVGCRCCSGTSQKPCCVWWNGCNIVDSVIPSFRAGSTRAFLFHLYFVTCYSLSG